MTKTIQQHYVPRSYLSCWGTEDGLISVFDKTSGRVFRTNPKNVAGKRHAYDIPQTLDPSDPSKFQYFEKLFSKIEDEMKCLFDLIRLRARQLQPKSGSALLSLPIGESEVRSLSKLTLVQMLRDMQFRDSIRSRQNTWLKRAWDVTSPILFGSEIAQNFAFDKVDEDYVKGYQMEFLSVKLERFAPALNEKIVVVGYNNSPVLLVTSDSPVSKLGYSIRPGIAWDGIASPSVIGVKSFTD